MHISRYKISEKYRKFYTDSIIFFKDFIYYNIKNINRLSINFC